MKVQDFARGREQLFAAPDRERLASARQARMDLEPKVAGNILASITLARTAEIDAALFTVSNGNSIGILTGRDGFVAIDGRPRRSGRGGIELAFREDTAEPSMLLPLGAQRRERRVSDDLSDASKTPEEQFEEEVIDGFGEISGISSSYWIENRLRLLGAGENVITVRTDPQRFLGMFAADERGTVLLEGQPEDEATVVPEGLDLSTAAPIPVSIAAIP